MEYANIKPLTEATSKDNKPIKPLKIITPLINSGIIGKLSGMNIIGSKTKNTKKNEVSASNSCSFNGLKLACPTLFTDELVTSETVTHHVNDSFCHDPLATSHHIVPDEPV